MLVFVIDAFAMMVAPPYDPQAEGGGECVYPVCFINGNLELPAPHVVWPEDYSATGLIVFEPSITSTLVTMWGVMVVTILTLVLMARGRAMIPGKAQNAIEHVWELLEGFATSLGGPASKPYIPLFAGFFLFILFCNWSGLLPFIGKVKFLRAPTSDVNITIGLALVAFVFFEYQGFRALGVGGYLSKFFPFGEFRKGVGAGIIAVFVGLIELLLEFVKPVTLSMRLFGNIYGGEVALARAHRADHRDHPHGDGRAGADAQPRAGAHLRDADPHVHPGRHGAPRRRGAPRGGGAPRARGHAGRPDRSWPRAH